MAKKPAETKRSVRGPVGIWIDTREAWPALSFYQRFEQVVAVLLTVLMSVVIVVAVWKLIGGVFNLLVSGLVDSAQPGTFQTIFGMFMIVLIALEFNHSLVGVAERHRSIVQVRTVVLIALLAVLRKFIIVEVGPTETWILLALSAAALVLGLLFWIVCVMDEPRRRAVAGEAESRGIK